MTAELRPAAILFDWDNTLVDSWATIGEALNHTLVAMGRPAWTADDIRARVRHSLANSFPGLFGTAWEQAKQIYLDRFEAIHLDRLRPLDGAEDQLRRLCEAGTYLALASNKTGRLLRREVEALGWTGYFSQVVGAGDAAADKPSRAPIDLALGGSGIPAGDTVWYVGDTGIDIDCALAAGCVPVLIHDDDPASDPRACHRLRDFRALAMLLDRLGAA